MNNTLSYERLLVLYLPWIAALIFANDPAFSYIIAWLGSFLIFALTLSGWVKPLPKDLNIGSQIMRPVILVHIIFAGYMCCTSFFYFVSLWGYENFHPSLGYFIVDHDKLLATAQCQRLYCLGHAAFISGILIFMKYPEKHRYQFDNSRIANVLFYAAIFTFPLYIIFDSFSGLSQFSIQFSSLSFIACTLALAFAIPQKKAMNTLICLTFYFSNFYSALISGYKEPIIISVLVLGLFLYPNYKKLVTLTFVPVLLILFIVLPTYASVIRDNAWTGETSDAQATNLALNAINNSSYEDIQNTNWNFLIYRLSEIDMFTTYVESTPGKIDYYKFEIVKQAGAAVIPRIFWHNKPITEDQIMERVYDAGVVNRGSKVSAKPAFIVDCYLSYGTLGVFIGLFIYGAAAQLISQKAESLFGGYLLGTALIFSGLFQILWRGLSFEFLLNSVVWSYISMLIIHRVLLARNIIQRT